jgi:hypothetical protein
MAQDPGVYPMRYIPLLLLGGCVSLADPLAHIHGHLSEIQSHMEIVIPRAIPGSDVAERQEAVMFHAGRALSWTRAGLEHTGAPSVLPMVPKGPSDIRGRMIEDERLDQWKAQAQAERGLKAGLMGLLGYGGMAGGASGLALVLLKKLQKAMLVAKQYDDAIEKTMSPEDRRKLQLPPEAKQYHAKVDAERKSNEGDKDV